ncbi:MAG: SDR family oxidoreductase [Gemmatimonadota bacterium]|nr:SDR family oxidoreductase [Gemmatimonadota bacterium]
MPTHQTVLLVGGTGRTGHRVLEQLLSRGASVRVIVRSPHKLRDSAAENPNLAVVEADLLSLSDDEVRCHLRGCDAVISCLGHVVSFRGVFGPPRDLVMQATARLCRGVEALQPPDPLKFVLMSSVSVNHPGGLDTRRGMFEKMIVWMLRGLVPPARDSQQAADFLWRNIGTANPFVQWVAVRPDTLLEGDVSDYALHEGLVSSLFAPASTNMANVAHFICELVANPKTWGTWKGKLPVIVNATSSKS